MLTGFGGPVNTSAILMKAINLRGVYVGSIAELRAAIGSAIRPVVDTVFSFGQAEEAYAHLRSGVHRGKVAIRISS